MKTYALSILMWLACSVTAAATPTLSLAPDRTWIPTKDNTCAITVNLTGAPANSTVTFQLISTNWPGYCMNGYDRGTAENPITTPDKSPDLRFVEASQPSHAEEPTSVALTWQLVAGGTEGPDENSTPFCHTSLLWQQQSPQMLPASASNKIADSWEKSETRTSPI